MKNLIVLSVLIVVLTTFTGCKKDNLPFEEKNPSQINELENLIKLATMSVIVVNKLSDKIISIEDFHSDYRINNKEYTSDKLRDYLNGLSRSKLKYGILMTYYKGGSWDSYSRIVLKHFCLKNDVDLFTYAPVNHGPIAGQMYSNDYVSWVNKSSNSYYAKDEFNNKVYLNELGEVTEDELPKSIRRITESESEHYIIDGKKYTAKELETYLNKFKFEDLKDGFLITINNTKKNEEACFCTLWKYCGEKSVNLYLKKSYVKRDSPKFGKIIQLRDSNRDFVRKMLKKLKVEENLVLSMLSSYDTDTRLTRIAFQDLYKSFGCNYQYYDEVIEYLYQCLEEDKLVNGLDLFRRESCCIKDTCFPKIVIFCIKNDVNIFLNVEKYLIDDDAKIENMSKIEADFIRKVYLEDWYYKAVKPLQFDYDFMDKVYNNGANEVLLTELPENILIFTELNTLKYKTSEKEYDADDLKKYLKSLDADALKSGILLKTNKTKKTDFPCFLVLEDFCVLNNVKLFIQRPLFDEKSTHNKRAFIYSNKVKKQAQEFEKTLDPSKNEILLSKISHKSEYVSIDQYDSSLSLGYENTSGCDFIELKEYLSQLNFDTEKNGIHVKMRYEKQFSENAPLNYLREFCKNRDLDLFVIYSDKNDKSKDIKAIWEVKSTKSPYIDDEYMRKVYENNK